MLFFIRANTDSVISNTKSNLSAKRIGVEPDNPYLLRLMGRQNKWTYLHQGCEYKIVLLYLNAVCSSAGSILVFFSYHRFAYVLKNRICRCFCRLACKVRLNKEIYL